MDSVLIPYKSTIQKVFKSYIDFLGHDDDTQLEIVMDDEHQRYLLVEIGWHNGRRIYGPLLHLDIINDKLWIQQDATEEGIANELVTLGIPKEQIVLGFKPLDRRKLTEFAAS